MTIYDDPELNHIARCFRCPWQKVAQRDDQASVAQVKELCQQHVMETCHGPVIFLLPHTVFGMGPHIYQRRAFLERATRIIEATRLGDVTHGTF